METLVQESLAAKPRGRPLNGVGEGIGGRVPPQPALPDVSVSRPAARAPTTRTVVTAPLRMQF